MGSMWVAMVGMSESTRLLKGQLKRHRISKLSLSKHIRWDVAKIESVFLSQLGCFFLSESAL